MDFNFTIYSLGDAAFLYTVLNAVSSIPESMYMQLGAFGAIIGLLIMGVKGVNEGSLMKAGFQGLIVSLVLFWIMFVARVDEVVVLDMAPNSTAPPLYVVDNVPAGFAAVGAATSGVGVFIARLFDQTFADVDGSRVLSGGVGDNLRRITTLRHMADPIWIEASGSNELALFRENIARFMAHCSMTALTTGERPNRTLMVREDLNSDGAVNALDGMHFPHRALQVRLRLKDGGSEVLSCAEAPTRINDESGFNPADNSRDGDPGMAAAMDRALGREGVATQEPAFRSTIDTMRQFGMPEAALWVQSAMVNQVAAAATAQSIRAGDTSSSGRLGAMMVEEAAARRNIQFAGEQNMFLRTMRTTIGFFEAVFYALGPVMAILIMTGPTGLAIASKYVLMTVWVLLWYPMLAIINLYGNVRMQSLVTDLSSNANYLTTPIGTHQILVIAQDQLGTIAGLVAATPILAMSLIYGGAVAMNAVAGRLTGGDMLNEGKLAPQAMDVAPVMQAGPVARSNAYSGTQAEGQKDIKFAGGELAQQALSVARTDAETDQRALGRAWGEVAGFGKSFALTGGTTEGTVEGNQFTKALTTALNANAGTQKAWAEAQSYAEKFGAQLNASISADGSIGWSAGPLSPIKVKGEVNSSVGTSAVTADEKTTLNNKLSELNTQINRSDGIGEGFATTLGESTQRLLSSVGTVSGSDLRTTALQESAGQAISSDRLLSEMTGLTTTSGISETATLANITQTLRNPEVNPAGIGAVFAKYESLMSDAGGDARQVQEAAFRNLRATGWDVDQAKLGSYWAAASSGAVDSDAANRFRMEVARDSLLVASAAGYVSKEDVEALRSNRERLGDVVHANPEVVVGGPRSGDATIRADNIRYTAENEYDRAFNMVEYKSARAAEVVQPQNTHDQTSAVIQQNVKNAEDNFKPPGLGTVAQAAGFGGTPPPRSEVLSADQQRALLNVVETRVQQRFSNDLERDVQRFEDGANHFKSQGNAQLETSNRERAAEARRKLEEAQERASRGKEAVNSLPPELASWAESRVSEVQSSHPRILRSVAGGEVSGEQRLFARVADIDQRESRLSQEALRASEVQAARRLAMEEGRERMLEFERNQQARKPVPESNTPELLSRSEGGERPPGGSPDFSWKRPDQSR